MLSLLPMLGIGLSLIQGADTARTRWTMAEYLALVEAVNPELVAARERVAAAEARIGPARRPRDPMLELELMNRSVPGFDKTSPVAMDQLRLRQSLPIPGALGAAADAARERTTADSGQLEETRLVLGWRVATDLIELNRIDRTTRLLGDLAPALSSLRDVAQARYAVAQAEQSDVIRAQLEVTRFAEELIMLQSERTSVVARLNAMALRAPDSRIDSITLPSSPDSFPSASELVNRAIASRPLFAIRQATRRAAAHDVRRAGLERWPELEVGLAYGQQPMFGGTGTDHMVSIMVGASLPIWSGSRQRQMRREAEAMERMAAADLTAAQAETQSRIVEAVARGDRATRLMGLYRSTLMPETRAAAVSALASYRTGAMDFEAVVSAQLAVVRLEMELVRLDAERSTVAAELAWLTGDRGIQ